MSPIVRTAGILAILLALVYGIACAIYNMPNSPVKARIVGASTHIIRPWFEQDWQLFAPTPSTANGHLYVTARMRLADGKVVTAVPFDIQKHIEDLPKSNRLLPTKQPGVTLAMQETFAAYRARLQAISVGAAPSAQKKLHTQLDKIFAADFDKLRRLISQQAAARFPGQHIISVRAEFSQTAITPFSERGNNKFPQEPRKKLLDTQWMPFAPGVSQP